MTSLAMKLRKAAEELDYMDPQMSLMKKGAAASEQRDELYAVLVDAINMKPKWIFKARAIIERIDKCN